MSGIPSAQLALENENRRLRERIAELERMLGETQPGESAHQSALSGRKQPEEHVNQSYKMLAELVERAPFGMYIVDSQFRIAHLNAASQAGVFRSVRPVIGRDLAETMRMLWPDTVAAGIIAAFRHTLNTGEPHYAPRFSNPRYDVESVEGYEWELYRTTRRLDGSGKIAANSSLWPLMRRGCEANVYTKVKVRSDRFLRMSTRSAELSGRARLTAGRCDGGLSIA